MKYKNTIIIWDGCGDGEPIKFFVVEGDYMSLDGTILNCEGDGANVARLQGLMWDMSDETMFDWRVPPTPSFPHEAYTPGETAVIVCGMIP